MSTIGCNQLDSPSILHVGNNVCGNQGYEKAEKSKHADYRLTAGRNHGQLFAHRIGVGVGEVLV